MKPQDVLKYFGTGYRFRKETGMSASTLRNWMIKGQVPKNAQYRIEHITSGYLKTDWSN